MSKKTNQTTLNKCDELISRLQELKKAIGSKQVASNRTPVNSLGAGWSSDPHTGALHHSDHGIISTTKHPDGYYQVNHGRRSVGRAASPAEAGTKIKNYVKNLKAGDTGMHNVAPMAMKKQEEEEVELDPRKARLKATKDRIKKTAEERNPAKLAAIEEANKLKKSFENKPWMNHAAVPNGDQEVLKAQKVNPAVKAENLMANQLANLMAGRAMLGTPPPRQPTDQEMFGHLIPSEEQIAKAEAKWANTMNWLEEASKPIASRFDSPEEEEAYWASLKVSDRDDGKSGY